VTAAFAFAIQNNWEQSMTLAKRHFIEKNQAATTSERGQLEVALHTIYENIRTLAQLPGVRAIDRHAKDFSDEAHVTFQQIYNNLASSVDVSEVYIVPIDFNPDKIDPVTLKNEEPILMYDQLIFNAGNGMTLLQRQTNPEQLKSQAHAGPPEVEKFEYAQLIEHAAWLKKHYPTNNDLNGLNVPFISGSEIITCDNTTFISTHNDKDRSGIMFSVPFYANDGKIHGMITTIILTNALSALLPSDHFALVNPEYRYAALANGAESMTGSRTFIETAKPDPSLIYSEAIQLSLKDSRSPWFIWSGLTNDSFYNDKDVLATTKARNSNLLMLAALAVLTAISMFLFQRNLAQTHRLNESLARGRRLAEQSEAEARATTSQLHILNEDIGRLNSALSQKVKQLTEAQGDIVRKGKMAQLGNLVATVAHELRNPLGGLRTTTFMLKRRLKDNAIDVTPQLLRMESGITRCDNIISQLLDFSRTQPLDGSKTQINTWLQTLVEEEVGKLSDIITVNLVMEEDEVIADCDTERLRRAVINLMTNAADAMVIKGVAVTERNPEIKINLYKSARGVEISFVDNGPGIPAELMKKIGEPLFTTKSFGTGLGIAAVQKVAELHHGGLDIHSEAGAGATFTIWFPVKNTRVMAA
jgi:signal transduction histidine kinase